MRRARPAAAPAVLRRPAARVREVEDSPEVVERKLQEGKEVLGEKVPPGRFKKGEVLAFDKARYYQAEASAAGKFVKEEWDGEDRYFYIEATGTGSERLLRHASGLDQALLQVHICKAGCPQQREDPQLLHSLKVRVVQPGTEAGWESNLVREEELGALRDDNEEWKKAEEEKKKREEEEKTKKKEAKSSSSRERKKKKKKKKKKEKKEKAEASSSAEERKTSKKRKKGEEESPEPSSRRVGGKRIARKSVRVVFGGTGMDPSYKVRRKLLKWTKQKMKKAKDAASSSSSTSSGSSSEESVDEGAFADRSQIHRMAEIAPGLLASEMLESIKPMLSQVAGTGWEKDQHNLPPLLTLYHRVYLSAKLTGGVGREFQTLCHIGDLLIQGRCAEALDSVCQRLKSIEMTQKGGSWQASQTIELAPAQEANLSSRKESQLALKEARLEREARPSAPAYPNKGNDKGQGKGKNKTKDKTKGKNKAGDAKKDQ